MLVTRLHSVTSLVSVSSFNSLTHHTADQIEFSKGMILLRNKLCQSPQSLACACHRAQSVNENS